METVWINGKQFEVAKPTPASEAFLNTLEENFLVNAITRCVVGLSWEDLRLDLSVDQLRDILYEIICKREKLLGLDQCDYCNCSCANELFNQTDGVV